MRYVFSMDKIDNDNYMLKSWCTKDITEPDEQWYIFKIFKKDWIHKPYPFEKQNSIIEKKKQYFWKFIPETELIKNDDGSYYIKQKFIKWKLVKFVDVNQLNGQTLSDLLELLKWYIAYCKDEWVEMDILWCQQDINVSVSIRERRLLFYTRLLNSFLSSTNIMISDDGKVYMIDVCDTMPLKLDRKVNKIKNTVRLAIMELWIKKTILKLRFLINIKNRELLSLLSW